MDQIAVPREVALADPTNHFFVPKIGYVYGGPLQNITISNSSQTTLASANPPLGVEDGSIHFLVTPGGHLMDFIWQTATQSWQKKDGYHKGTRLSFTPSYLTINGWRYYGVA